MTSIKNVVAAAAVTLAASGVAVAVSAPAQAATGYDRCPAAHMCLFDEDNGNGAMAWFKTGSPDLRGQSFDNRTNSVWNRTSGSFRLYQGYNYSGDTGTVPVNVKSNVFRNVYSSVKRVG